MAFRAVITLCVLVSVQAQVVLEVAPLTPGQMAEQESMLSSASLTNTETRASSDVQAILKEAKQLRRVQQIQEGKAQVTRASSTTNTVKQPEEQETPEVIGETTATQKEEETPDPAPEAPRASPSESVQPGDSRTDRLAAEVEARKRMAQATEEVNRTRVERNNAAVNEAKQLQDSALEEIRARNAEALSEAQDPEWFNKPGNGPDPSKSYSRVDKVLNHTSIHHYDRAVAARYDPAGAEAAKAKQAGNVTEDMEELFANAEKKLESEAKLNTNP